MNVDPPRTLSVAAAYGVALLGVLLATGLTVALWPVLNPYAFAFYFLVLMPIGLQCGRGPAFFAVLVSVVLQNFLLFTPRFTWSLAPAILVGQGMYLLVAVAICALTDQFRGARAREVAEQARAARATRESEARLRLSLDAGGVGVWEWDIAKNHVHWSDRVYEIHGVEPGSFDGTVEAFGLLIHPEDRARVREAIRAALEEGASYALEFRAVRPSGEVRWVSTRARVLQDAQGKPALMLGATLDITERQALEEELRRHAEELAEADRRKDEFLAMLAHELRNPLAPILNAVQILRLRGASDPHLARQRDTIERQARHLARMVDDLLDVSRITRGKIELRRDWVDLAGVVEQAVQACAPQIEARQHELVVSLPRERSCVDGDHDRLCQVLINLLSNAAKYTPPGGRIELTLGREGEVAVLRVKDNGEGIASEFLPHVFDLFMQADRSLDRSQGGLGIGLTMVKNLVEAHGGSVRASSPGPGRGSEFVVRLPALPEDCGEPAETPLPAARASAGRRVFIVEDNRDAAETLQEILELWGHEVRAVHTGSGAVEAALAYRPDLILLDIGLPGMNGYEIARELRKRMSQAPPVLVAITGYGGTDDRQRAHEAGFDHHLVKPVAPAALARILAEMGSGAPAG